MIKRRDKFVYTDPKEVKLIVEGKPEVDQEEEQTEEENER